MLPVPIRPRPNPRQARRCPGKVPAPINWHLVSWALQAGATVEDVAASQHMSSQHLRRRIKAATGIAAAVEIERMRRTGKMAIRLKQFALATEGGGNVQMLIWLGKQRLDEP